MTGTRARRCGQGASGAGVVSDKDRKATTRRRKTPPIVQGCGDRLLLGWRTQPSTQPIGFREQARGPAVAEANPVWLEGEGHLITIAPTGAGKGRGALIPNLLLYEGSAIVIDPKGEAYRVTARRRRALGQAVYVIDPFGLVVERSDSLNPLDMMDIPDTDQSALAMDIARQLSGGKQSLKDPFWDIRGHDLLAGIISAVSSTQPPDKRNLARVREWLKADDVVCNLALLLDHLGETVHRFAKEEIANFLQITEVTRSGILATAASYTSVIGSDAAQRTLLTSTIDLQAVRRGDPMTIYLVVPPDKLASHASLFRLWTAALMSAVLSRRPPLPQYRTLFVIDECAQLGDFDLLAMVYTLARSYGMRVWAFFQDLAQIKRLLEKDWQTVITNSAAVQAFGVTNQLMASDLAPVLGDFTDRELRFMDRAHLALQMAGAQGLELRRPDYLTDTIFKGLFDAKPMAMGPPGPTGRLRGP